MAYAWDMRQNGILVGYDLMQFCFGRRLFIKPQGKMKVQAESFYQTTCRYVRFEVFMAVTTKKL
jgi:hypothetical protein